MTRQDLGVHAVCDAALQSANDLLEDALDERDRYRTALVNLRRLLVGTEPVPRDRLVAMFEMLYLGEDDG